MLLFDGGGVLLDLRFVGFENWSWGEMRVKGVVLEFGVDFWMSWKSFELEEEEVLWMVNLVW